MLQVTKQPPSKPTALKKRSKSKPRRKVPEVDTPIQTVSQSLLAAKKEVRESMEAELKAKMEAQEAERKADTDALEPETLEKAASVWEMEVKEELAVRDAVYQTHYIDKRDFFEHLFDDFARWIKLTLEESEELVTVEAEGQSVIYVIDSDTEAETENKPVDRKRKLDGFYVPPGKKLEVFPGRETPDSMITCTFVMRKSY